MYTLPDDITSFIKGRTPRTPVFLETAAVTAAVMILAELADKTSLLTMSIASKTSKPFTVGSAALVGIGSMTIAGVIAGLLLEQVIPVQYLQVIAALLFIGIGMQGLRNSEEETDTPENHTHLFITTAGLVALAEVGDKSQLFVVGQVLVNDPLAVMLGAIVGMAAVLYSSAYAGHRFLAKIPTTLLSRISSVIFITIGLLIMIQLVA